MLSTGIFRELKRNFPKSEITAIVSNQNRAIIEKNKHIDKIISLGYPPNSLSSLKDYLNLSRKIKKEKYDLGIDLRGSIFNIIFFLTLPKIRYKIGFYNRLPSKLFLDYAYKKNRKTGHCAPQRIDLINKALNLKSTDYWPEIATDKSDLKNYKTIVKKHSLKKYICIVPDASIKKKQWSLTKFNSLIKHLNKTYPKQKILLIGSDEKKILYLAKHNLKSISILNENLRTVSLLFKNSSLVLTHDGGAMHIAWATKSKLLALFSKYLNINYLRPLGKDSHVIIAKHADMNSISLREVKDKIKEIL